MFAWEKIVLTFHEGGMIYVRKQVNYDAISCDVHEYGSTLVTSIS